MSAGHRHKQAHTDTLIRQTKALLADRDIKAYLRKPFTTDFSRKIPLTGGSSVDGKRYFVDPDVPQKLRKYILWHERVEKALRDIKKMKYAEAHKYATAAERLMVEADKRDWKAYEHDTSPVVRSNEKRGVEDVPKDFDKGPYKESGEMKLIK